MADVSETLTGYVSDEFLREFEEKFNDEKGSGVGAASCDTTFQYAWCLVRSRLRTDVKKGILLLEDLLRNKEADSNRRDCLYYLAVAHARSKDYHQGLKFIKALLQNEPGNKQAQDLEKEIRKSMDSDAMKGAAIAGGGLLVAGALVGLGMAFLKK